MLVLDYLRHVRTGEDDNPYLVVPPFHTGILGFPPGTKVFSNLTVSKIGRPEETACEILISPFTQQLGRMFHLEVLLADEKGVILRVLKAINALGLNIVKQESTIINTDRHHFVQFILDWSTSEDHNRHKRSSLPSDLARFATLHDRIPIEDARYLDLYEQIMVRCADVVVVDSAFEKPLPSVYIRPFCNRRFEANERVEVKKAPPTSEAPGQRYDVRIDVTQHTLERIRQNTGFGEEDRIPYVLASYGLHRTLRVFFPTRSMAERSVRLAFYHRDLPGALLEFCRLLERADLNIWNTLVRKIDENAAIFEVLASYEGPDAEVREPLPEDRQARRERERRMTSWAAKTLARTIREDGSFERLRVYAPRLSTPLYPRFLAWDAYFYFEETASGKVTRKKVDRGVLEDPLPREDPPSKSSEADDHDRDVLEDVARGDVPARGARPNEMSPRRALALAVMARRQHPHSRVFLSYPKHARSHAACVRERLSDCFVCEVVEYQDPDFADITRRATNLILGSDYFIGIWHHESLSGALDHTVSPWMPFEYGVAMANFGRETLTDEVTEISRNAILVYSGALPEAITKRIQTGFAHPSYSDLDFKDRTLEQVIAHGRDVWRLPERTREYR